MARASHGFGTKSLLWDVLLAHFRKPPNSGRLARAFLGSSCEQWVNGEFFQAVTRARKTVWARPEKEKMDLVLYESYENERARKPGLILETKVLYSPESLRTQSIKLERLRTQLAARQHTYPKACVAGIVVYFDYEYSRDNGSTWLPNFGRMKRERFINKAALGKLRLRNMFGEKHGRVALWPGIRNLSMCGFQYRLSVHFQVVRHD
jgi:hypothetical protein